MARLYFLSYSDPTVLTFQLPAYFTRVTLLASHHSWVSCEFQLRECSWLHTFDQFFTLSHTQPLHDSHLNTGFLIAKLQANLARNKANTWLNKLNLTISHLVIPWQNPKIDSRLKKCELGIVVKIHSHLILDLWSSWTIQISFLKTISQIALH